MSQSPSLNPYKQDIKAFYQARTNYDNDFTYRRAIPLIDLVKLKPGEQVLDVATGTGIIAIAAAEQVGAKGEVIGVDFTPGMLDQARKKIAASGLEILQLIEADVETLEFANERFDVIFCATAIVLLSDIPAALRDWYRWLKPGGRLAFSCWSPTSFFTPVIMNVCAQQGFALPNLHEFLGSPEKCYTLLQEIGFQDIEVKTGQFGYYLSLEEAQNFWQGKWLCANGHPLLTLSQAQIEELKAAFKQDIQQFVTDQGVWLENTTFFVIGKKINIMD